MASQITSPTIVYSAVYPGTDQRKHQSSASLAFVREFTGEFPAQKASNSENSSIWWRHHGLPWPHYWTITTTRTSGMKCRVTHHLECVLQNDIIVNHLYLQFSPSKTVTQYTTKLYKSCLNKQTAIYILRSQTRQHSTINSSRPSGVYMRQ